MLKIIEGKISRSIIDIKVSDIPNGTVFKAYQVRNWNTKDIIFLKVNGLEIINLKEYTAWTFDDDVIVKDYKEMNAVLTVEEK